MRICMDLALSANKEACWSALIFLAVIYVCIQMYRDGGLFLQYERQTHTSGIDN